MVTIIEKGKGGVQPGGSSFTEASLKLDQQLKTIANKLRSEFKGFASGHKTVASKRQGTKRKSLFEGIYCGCVPDGGLWLDDNLKVRVAIEAKVQGNHGNAVERHAKNLIICQANQSPKGLRYVTFMAGGGAIAGGVLDNYAKTILTCVNPPDRQSINILHSDGVSFFLSENGWSDEEIETIMREALKE